MRSYVYHIGFVQSFISRENIHSMGDNTLEMRLIASRIESNVNSNIIYIYLYSTSYYVMA